MTSLRPGPRHLWEENRVSFGSNFIGKVLNTTCYALVNSNARCETTDLFPTSFGLGVAANGGGAVTCSGTASVSAYGTAHVLPHAQTSIVFAPSPSAWPEPSAFWSSTTCPMAQFFSEHNIVINTSFCGDSAGCVYSSSGCPATCEDDVADLDNFKDAEWKINYVAIFQ